MTLTPRGQSTGKRPRNRCTLGLALLAPMIASTGCMNDPAPGTLGAAPIGPVADAGSTFVAVQADEHGDGHVVLDGTGSTSLFGPIVDYGWLLAGAKIARGSVAEMTLPVGRHEITLVVTDVTGLTASTRVIVTVAPFVDPAALPRFFLPWAPGHTFTVSQGNDGPFTHQGRFAWDFPMPVGTPVLAAAAGRVIEVRDNVASDGSTPQSPADAANYVTIDHGRGLQSFYAHLDDGGVAVVPGQLVVAGQVIGVSGNTGLSSAPHLHYEVFDVAGSSVPSGFVEVAASGGVAAAGDEAMSANELEVRSVEGYFPSSLPADAFLMNGVELTGPLPPAFYYENQTDYQISGRVLNDAARVCVALVDADSRETVFCDLLEVDEVGGFAIPFQFPAELVGPHFFGVISGPDGAEGVVPQPVVINPPGEGTRRPQAVIDRPSNPLVDFGDARPLIGSHSFSPGGRALTYRWQQVSGPPVLLADPAAADTAFTEVPGTGIGRVAFQLAVSDRYWHSLPAEVEFVMPDTFVVGRIGVSATPCLRPEECPVFDPPPPVITYSTELILGWVEVFNATVGDVLTFTVADPRGDIVRENELTILSEPASPSFWRFGSTSVGLKLLPGLWTGTFLRRGVAEATVTFRVEP